MGGRGYLASMGHLPFYWATPDGYPDVKEAWAASASMLTRWNFGLALTGAGPNGASVLRSLRPVAQMPAEIATAGEAIDYWVDRVLHRPVDSADREVLIEYLTEGGDDTTALSARLPGSTRQVADRLPETIALILDSPYFQWR
jgi:hypothetical protein